MTSAYQTGNFLVVGTTQYGKSTAEIVKIVAAAEQRDVAIVVIDPHPQSLAWKSFMQLTSRGFKSRILFDQLPYLKRVLGYRFLPISNARDPLRRAAQNEQTAREFADVLTRRRGGRSLSESPQTEEWTLNAMMLMLSQPAERPASDLRYAYQINHPTFHELVDNCTDPDIKYTFTQVANKSIKAGQYTAAARLISGICNSPAFAVRCGTSFDLPHFLDKKGILLIEGGTQGISEDAARTIMGSVILQVINYIRSRNKSQPRVLLVLDEATNANLIGKTGHEVRAMAECQKMGLDIHVLVQGLNFPSDDILEDVLTNCTTHEWFYNANDKIRKKAAADLGGKDEDDDDYYTKLRRLKVGERFTIRRSFVKRDRVKPLDDLWTIAGLAEKKAYIALSEIRFRNEYQQPSWQSPDDDEDDDHEYGEEILETPLPSESSDEPCEPSTSPAQEITADTSEPASDEPEQKSTWKQRDQQIIDLATIHVCTIEHFQPLFPSKSATYRRIAKLRDRGRLHHVGSVLRDTGRPTDAFCNGWNPKHLRHEVLLTDFLLCYPEAHIIRGNNVDQKILPDAHMTLNDRLCYVELDTGKETHTQYRERQKAYRGISELLLFVTLSPTRKDNLIENAATIKNIALFTTLAEAMDNPHGEIWIDCTGKRTSI